MKKQLKILIGLGIVLAITIPGTYFGLKYILEDTIDSAELDFTKIQLSEFSESFVNGEIEFSLIIDSPVEASFQLTNLSLEYDNTNLGSIFLVYDDYSTDTTEYESNFTLTIANIDLYYQFVANFVEMNTLSCIIRGHVEFEGGLAALPEQDFNKSIALQGMAGLSYSIESFDIQDLNEDTAKVAILTELSNPSSLSAIIPGIYVSLVYQENSVGHIIEENMTLNMGDNQFDLNTTINLEGTSIVEDFLSMPDLSFDISLKIYFGDIEELDSIPELFNDTISVAGIDYPNPSIENMTLIDTHANELFFELEAILENPSQLSANISEVWIDLYYETKLIGNATAENVTFAPGTNEIMLNAILGGNTSILEEILGNYINGDTTLMDLNISLAVLFEISESVFSHQMMLAYQLPGITTPLITVNDIDIALDLVINFLGQTASITTFTNVSINNPMNFNITLQNFQGDVIYDDIHNLGSIDLATDGDLTYPTNITALDSISDTVEMHPSISYSVGYSIYTDGTPIIVDILNGILDLTIGDFSISVSGVEILDIEAPLSHNQ